MKLIRFLIVSLLVLLVAAGCIGKGDTPTGIGKLPALGRGVISNVEPLNNGLFQIWIFGDSTYVYCTVDKTLIDKAKAIMAETNATILYEYRDWKAGDPEFETHDSNNNRLSYTCGQGYTGARGSKLLSVVPVH